MFLVCTAVCPKILSSRLAVPIMSYNPEADERAPLLLPDPPVSPEREAAEHAVPARIARRLYISHFLSTWNSRVFEFGAVLYLATIYPGTLRPMSVYALTRGLAAIVFAPVVGQYIDTGNRLQVVRVSIGSRPPPPGCIRLSNSVVQSSSDSL